MSTADYTQLTFHFQNGQAESFNIPLSPQELQQQLFYVLDKPFVTLHLRDQTVAIATSQVLKVEIKPALSELQGEAIFPNCERVTALNRGR